MTEQKSAVDQSVEQSQVVRVEPWWHWHRKMYNWVLHFAKTPQGPIGLFILSFADSSFFRIPPGVRVL